MDYFTLSTIKGVVYAILVFFFIRIYILHHFVSELFEDTYMLQNAFIGLVILTVILFLLTRVLSKRMHPTGVFAKHAIFIMSLAVLLTLPVAYFLLTSGDVWDSAGIIFIGLFLGFIALVFAAPIVFLGFLSQKEWDSVYVIPTILTALTFLNVSGRSTTDSESFLLTGALIAVMWYVIIDAHRIVYNRKLLLSREKLSSSPEFFGVGAFLCYGLSVGLLLFKINS